MTKHIYSRAKSRYFAVDILIVFLFIFFLSNCPEIHSILLKYLFRAPVSYATVIIHDDVIKCKHFPRYWPPVNSPHKGQWRGAVMFSLICAWMNGWVNTRKAGDLRRNRPIMTSVEWLDKRIGLDHDLSPNRRQAFICTNDGLGYWRFYASLGLKLINSLGTRWRIYASLN